ncbi:MAG: branched-chain amino acid ABC transporter permease, partial [Pseudomonadota bacterium]
ASVFGIVNQVFTFAISPVTGEVALLVAAVILLRLLPQGITSKFFKRKL